MMKPLLFLALIPLFHLYAADDCNEAGLHSRNTHYCIKKNIPFEIALGCGEANLNSTAELACLIHRTPADIAQECGNEAMSPADKTICVVKRTMERRGVNN